MQRSTRRTTGAAITILGLLLSVIGLLATPASAAKPDPGEAPADCSAMFNGSPDAQLTISSDPATGTTVADGDEIDATLTWPTNAWNDVSKVYLCVKVDGVISDDLTDVEKPGVNDGTQAHSFIVPAGANEVCVVGRVSGTPNTEFNTSDSTHKSNTLCWPVGEVEECPQGTTWVDDNENQVIDEGECETPEVEECPQGTTWVDDNENEVVDEGECETPEVVVCPQGTTWVDANQNQVVDERECQTPPPPGCQVNCGPTLIPADLSASIGCAVEGDGLLVTIENDGDLAGLVDVLSDDVVVANDLSVPGNGSVTQFVTVEEDTAYDIDVAGVETFTGTRNCTEVLPEVIVPQTPEEPEIAPNVITPAPTPPAVLGVQLPRTGSDSLPLSAAGFGLLVLGAGLVLAGRRGDHATA